MTMRALNARLYAIAMLAIVFAFALGSAPKAAAQAQVASGQIVGTSYDATGAVVPQAKVTLDSKATGLHRETVTSDDGTYTFVTVPIGMYVVAFSKAGFKLYKVDVEVTVGAAVTVNAKLEVGEVTQVVEVTASALIESTQSQPDALIGVRSIEELPINGRRFQDFVTLTPTVQIEPQRNQISFAGQRGVNSNITIDGADYYEPFFGGIRGGERSNNAFTIPQEAISQFQVVAYGYSVEFGRSTGGILNATTKSGANAIHGSGFMYARNSALAWNDPFGNTAVTNLYEFGGSLGGPIKKDKMFFFGAYEQQKNKIPHLVQFSKLAGFTPTPSQTEAFTFYQGLQSNGAGVPYDQTNDALTGFGRLDIQPNTNHRLSISYHYSRNTGLNAVSTGDSLALITTRSLDNNGTEGDQTNNGTVSWTAIWSPHLVQETRVTHSLENRPRLANSTLAGIQDTVATTGTRDFLSTVADDYRTQATTSLSWTHGSHAVKVGGEFDYLNIFQFFKFNQTGQFIISGSNVGTVLQILSANPSGGQNRFDNTSVTYKVNIGNGLLTSSMKQMAFFLQDTWRITPRFTLTAGFRWEGYVNPHPDVSNTALYNKVKNFPFPIGFTVDPAFVPNNYRQYMPRVGIAWDPAGNAKTVIRASAGFFYAQNPLILFAAPLNNYRLPAGDLTVQLPLPEPVGGPCRPTASASPTVYCQIKLIGIDLNNFTLDKLPILTPTQFAQIAALIPGGAPDPFKGAAPISLANNYESPRSWQWSVGMEQEIKRGWSVGADFAYINTAHLERDRNLNLPPPILFTGATVSGPSGPVTFGPDLSLRPCFGVVGNSVCTPSTKVGSTTVSVPTRARPIPGLSDITVRETGARSRYSGFTLRTNYRRGRLQLQSYYTLSWNYSTDDNERLASGFDHDNEFNLTAEHGFSRLDARHLWATNGLIDLPLGFTVSALGKFRSGHPMEPLAG
jgi:outer membrane receptor for ferrienterochelin and colicin